MTISSSPLEVRGRQRGRVKSSGRRSADWAEPCNVCSGGAAETGAVTRAKMPHDRIEWAGFVIERQHSLPPLHPR
jgi:hypothetical protein